MNEQLEFHGYTSEQREKMFKGNFSFSTKNNPKRIFDEYGNVLKEKGIRKVSENESLVWRERAINVVNQVMQVKDCFTADDIRLMADEFGLPEPHHPNVWGALLSGLSKSGVIHKTGQYIASRLPVSHGRIIPIWERSNN